MQGLILSALVVLFGCSPKPVVESANPHPTVPTTVSENLASSYSSRNFDEMIKIYARATGVHQSRSIIRTEVEKIKAQLPMYNNPLSYNAFNQIAISALALRFCQKYVEDNTTGTDIFFGVQYTYANRVTSVPLIADELIKRLALTEEADDPFLSKVKVELISVMTWGASPTLQNMNSNPLPSQIVMVGCGLFLGTSYFTMD